MSNIIAIAAQYNESNTSPSIDQAYIFSSLYQNIALSCCFPSTPNLKRKSFTKQSSEDSFLLRRFIHSLPSYHQQIRALSFYWGIWLLRKNTDSRSTLPNMSRYQFKRHIDVEETPAKRARIMKPAPNLLSAHSRKQYLPSRN